MCKLGEFHTTYLSRAVTTSVESESDKEITVVGSSYDASEDITTITDETCVEPGDDAVYSADGAMKPKYSYSIDSIKDLKDKNVDRSET